MIKLVRLFFIIVLFLQANTVLAFAHRKIDYIVSIRNMCQKIENMNIKYDGEDLLPGGGGRDLGRRSTASYMMPMTIPDIAQVSWFDLAGKAYEEKVPLRSLISFRDYFGRAFRVEFHFCNGELSVIFGKKFNAFEYNRK
jgi:hypothetical protein